MCATQNIFVALHIEQHILFCQENNLMSEIQADLTYRYIPIQTDTHRIGILFLKPTF